MGKLMYDRIIKYRISATVNTPMHIGSFSGDSEEVLTDTSTGVPFIQAAGLSGMLRNLSGMVNGEDETQVLFGTSKSSAAGGNDSNSRVKITDGLFKRDSIKLETRPNISIDRETGTVSSKSGMGQKFNITYVSPGAKFDFFIYLYLNDDKEEAATESVLGALKNQSVMGSKKSSGAGRFTVDRIDKVVFDMKTAEGRLSWACEDDEEKVKYSDITSACASDNSPVKYVINICAQTEGPIQIKGLGVSEVGDAPDSENIRDSCGECIIPGTSVRGAIRSRMEMIADYQNRKCIIDNAFGLIGEKQSDSKAGNLVFFDSRIGESESNDKNPIRNRIHIDKFTGGVINGGFFKEKNANGEVNINIQILDKNDPDSTLGLLLYALRDLAAHTYNLGSVYSIGKGYVNIDKIEISSGENKSAIEFGTESKTNDESGIIAGALKALKEVQE